MTFNAPATPVTRKDLERALDEGGAVIHQGRHIFKKDELPTDEELRAAQTTAPGQPPGTEPLGATAPTDTKPKGKAAKGKDGEGEQSQGSSGDGGASGEGGAGDTGGEQPQE